MFYYLVNFSVGTLGGTNNIQEIFCVFPRVFGACCGYRTHSIPYAGSQLMAIVIFDLYVILYEKIWYCSSPVTMEVSQLALLGRSIRQASCD
jgi:hypothetical protein